MERQFGRLARGPNFMVQGGTSFHDDVDGQLSEFKRATAEQQRKLASALADALSTITSRVDRIESRPPSEGEVLASKLDEMSSHLAALTVRGGQASPSILNDAVSELSQKLGEFLVGLDKVSDRLAAAVTAIESLRAADAAKDASLEALRSEVQALAGAQATSELRAVTVLGRLEAALVEDPMADVQRPHGAVQAPRTRFMERARRAAPFQSRRREARKRDEETRSKARDLARPRATRVAGLAVAGGGALAVALLLYGAQFLTRAPEKLPVSAAVVSAEPPPTVRAAETVSPVVARSARVGAPPPQDRSAVDEFASRLLRGDAILRDRPMDQPAAPAVAVASPKI